jgi:XTP/dITP diphosphohydrolase
MKVYFATSNEHKFEEAKNILEGIMLERFDFSHREIRSDSLEEIAREAVEKAYAEIQKPVFVEDTGLFIDSLNGFPGTYSGWVLGKIGFEGILRLIEGKDKCSAKFQTVIAYRDEEGTKTFFGECPGSIAKEAKGESGFGYDSIFIPEGHSQTFAQSIILKNKLSHRYISLLKLRKYFSEANLIR